MVAGSSGCLEIPLRAGRDSPSRAVPLPLGVGIAADEDIRKAGLAKGAREKRHICRVAEHGGGDAKRTVDGNREKCAAGERQERGDDEGGAGGAG